MGHETPAPKPPKSEPFDPRETIYPFSKGERRIEVDPTLLRQAEVLKKVADIPGAVPSRMGNVRKTIASELQTIEEAKSGKFAMMGRGDEDWERQRQEAVRNAEANIKANELRLIGLALLAERLKKSKPGALVQEFENEIANLRKNLAHFEKAGDAATAGKIGSELKQYESARKELDLLLREARGEL